ncbi:DNA cytosine methyltransferase [Sungkyunkwania multivorans]|uniref:Cytosine-specific methyltransferase n=1 Tax=Sungkyunkwania multivorans TaxID=1173618 RepID=A0ABW3CW08_9FLAO
MSKEILRVVELFAGVGGFRLGLEQANRNFTDKVFEIVWSNQWEPSTKTQHASLVYEARFGAAHHSNEDISEVPTDDIPDHDLLVGGFPCQDYSVATALKNSKGLIGKKGVLWWSIHRILSEKKNKPKYLLLENVDRLLKSPVSQRGRDFAIILKSLEELDYAVEWRVINAADYGMPQRRRRVFILAYHKSTKIHKIIQKSSKADWISQDGLMASSFASTTETNSLKRFAIDGDLVALSKDFNKNKKGSPFENSGVFLDGTVYTGKTTASFSGRRTTLKDILQNGEAEEEFFIPEEEISKWEYLKGAKKEVRKSSNGFEYHYSEGSMVFPDALDKPSRTIITGEGGKSASRFKHVVQTDNGLRRLTPIELERLNMFPDDHTKLPGITNAKRAFFMGNALVVGIVERIATEILNNT